VEGALTISGVPIRLIDTAGLGTTEHPIEVEGMRRTRRAISESDLLIIVIDGSVHSGDDWRGIVGDREPIVVISKSDLPPCLGRASRALGSRL
jgi:tRNA modification GTPase